ncbi:MAG: hypothetical protein ACIALR_14450 [Blastopirellula sp. JB062]
MHLVRYFIFAGLLATAVGCGGSGATSAVDLNSEALSQLPEGDRELAVNQWSCLVCRELLGHQGMPLKSEKTGSPVFCCTSECLAAFEKNPKKYQSAMAQ